MLVVPLSHERNLARRWPWVSTAIVFLNVAALFLCTIADQRVATGIEERVQRAAEYYAEHPWLELRSPLSTLLPALARTVPARTPAPEAALAEQQTELDRYTQDIAQALHQLSSWRYGYNHARGEWPGLLTHQFLHGGVMHLLFNMWFLWLVGCNVEDAWGRLLFPAFYLSGGAIAGLAHAWMVGSSSLTLIGASGAVAAAMGAFLVRFARTRIRFFGLLPLRSMTFAAPAYVMLPLWVMGEFVSGVADNGPGVAHWAHVGGFAYGLLVALGLRLSGIEQRIDALLEDQSEGFAVNPAIARASALIDAGKAADAVPLLREHGAAQERSAAREQGRALALSELLRAQKALGDREGALGTQLRLLEGYLQQQSIEQALGVFEELRAEGACGRVAPHLRLRLARQYRRRGDVERAASAFEELHSASERSEHSLPALLGHAELALELGRADAARQLYERARSFVSMDVQVEAAIRQGLARASQLRRPSTQPPPPA